MNWQYTGYVVALFALAPVTLLLGFYAWRHRHMPGATPFAITMLCLSQVAIAYGLELATPDLETKVFWLRFKLIGVSFLPVTWLATTLQFAGHERWLSRRTISAALVVPAITTTMILTNHLHGLILRSAYLDASGSVVVMVKAYGLWFFVHSAYSYLLLLVSMPLLLQMADASLQYREQAIALLAGMLLPVISVGVFLAGLSPVSHVDPTPVVMCLAALIWGWALFRFRLFRIVPIARARVVEGMADGVLVIDAHCQIIDLNPAAANVLRLSRDRVVGQPAAVALAAWPQITGLCSHGQDARHEVELGTADDARQYEVRFSRLGDHDQAATGTIIVLHDITNRIRLQRDLQDSNQRLVMWVRELEQRNREISMLNEMGELVQGCHTVGDLYEVSAKFLPRLFSGDSGGLFVLNASRDALEAVACWGEMPWTERSLAPNECPILKRGRGYFADEANQPLRCAHGDHTRDACFCLPLLAPGDTFGVLHVRAPLPADSLTAPTRERLLAAKKRLAVTAAEHIALALANVKLHQTLREQAIRDPLTGLFNRRYMEETLEREVSRALSERKPVGIMMLDVDHFKRFNDAYGHIAGDTLLAALGGYLRNRIRTEDIACRYGGEEFTLILPGSTLKTVRERAEDLCTGFRQLSMDTFPNLRDPVTISIGVAAFPENGDSGDSVLRVADIALYASKAQGGDRVEPPPLPRPIGADA